MKCNHKSRSLLIKQHGVLAAAVLSSCTRHNSNSSSNRKRESLPPRHVMFVV